MLFSSVLGHSEIKKKLTDNVLASRISHAQLFEGPEGIGKLAMLLAYARYILCEDRSPIDSCGVCASCRKVHRFEHPDLHFYFPTFNVKDSEGDGSDEKKSGSKGFYGLWREMLQETPYFDYNDWQRKLGVENQQTMIYKKDCDDIIRDISFKPLDGRYKIVVVWMVERFDSKGATRLLKYIEEPPDGTIFLMHTQDRNSIVKTLLSRLQQIKFPLLPDSVISDHLVEHYGLEPQKAHQISFMAEGSFTYALHIMENLAEVEEDLESFRVWMRICFKKNPGEIFAWVDQFAKWGRERQKTFLKNGLSIFRQCLLTNYRVMAMVRATPTHKDFLMKFSKFVNHRNGLDLIRALEHAVYHVERNANPKILFTDLSFELARLLRSTA